MTDLHRRMLDLDEEFHVQLMGIDVVSPGRLFCLKYIYPCSANEPKDP